MSNVIHGERSRDSCTCVWRDSCTWVPWLIITNVMSHGTHVHESRHIPACFPERSAELWYAWVTSHVWMSHVTHVNESRHTREWVTSRTWMSRSPHVNQSCHHYYYFPAFWAQPAHFSCRNTLPHIVTRYNALQHTATHCNTLQHTATRWNTLWFIVTHRNTPQHTSHAASLGTLQRTFIIESCHTHNRVMSHT